jgi:hypothetical protein
LTRLRTSGVNAAPAAARLCRSRAKSPGDELASRIVVITQLAEELDRHTLDLALRIVPVEWWEARLGATVRPERRTDIVPSAGSDTHGGGTARA